MMEEKKKNNTALIILVVLLIRGVDMTITFIIIAFLRLKSYV